MQAGFSLLEAIVALALIATAGLALFTWIGQGIETAGRLQAAQERAALQLQALALVERINPARQPSGEITAAGLSVKWRSSRRESMRPVFGFLGASGSEPVWQVGLYVLDVTAQSLAPAGNAVRFELLKAGWQQGRVAAPAEPGKP